MTTAQKIDLDHYKWKNRLLLLNTINESAREQQLKVFFNNPEALADRKLLILVLENKKWQVYNPEKALIDTIKTLQIEKQFKLQLIGLDGGEKKSYEQFTQAATIFELIDSMPMRAREMRGKI